MTVARVMNNCLSQEGGSLELSCIQYDPDDSVDINFRRISTMRLLDCLQPERCLCIIARDLQATLARVRVDRTAYVQRLA